MIFELQSVFKLVQITQNIEIEDSITCCAPAAGG